MLMYRSIEGESNVEYLTRISQSATIFKLLMFSFVAISSIYIFGTLLTANNNLKYLNIVAIIGLVINLSLNFMLIPKFQAIGSAYANLSAQGITALLQIILAHKLLGLKVNYRLYLRITVLVVSLVIFGFLFKEIFVLEWKLSCTLLIILGFLIALILKLFHLKELIQILKSN